MNRDRIASLLAQFAYGPYMLAPDWFAALMGSIERFADGGEWDFAEQLAERFAARSGNARSEGTVAVVPMVGVLTQRGDPLAELFGFSGPSTQRLTSTFRKLAADDSVKAVVLDIDSPGGPVGGVFEAAEALYVLRQTKRTVAVANSNMQSGAYLIGSAATEIAMAPEAEIGSIGVIAAHFDRSKMFERMGVKPTLITAGKYKGELNPFGPLSEDTKQHLQSQADELHTLFIKAVAKHRGDTQGAVREGYGEGRSLLARDAIKAKLADRIATLDEMIGQMAAAPARRALSAESVRTIRDFENALRDAGLTNAEARALASVGWQAALKDSQRDAGGEPGALESQLQHFATLPLKGAR